MLKECIPASTHSAPLNPTRRVNYEFGMVLGVTDFRQEQAHFQWKSQLSNRLLHGYGTVSGLRVTAEGVQNPHGVQIRVSAGYAVSPQGRWLWVENDLCAWLNNWLTDNVNQSSPPLGPGRHRLYVTLCYDECPTELTPVAGKACASDQDTRVPSRVQEAYQVRFSWQKPEQLGEDSIRRFGDLLNRIALAPEESPPLPDDSQRLLDAALELAILPEMSLTSPPDAGPFYLHKETASETIRQLLTLWITRAHPQLYPAVFGPHRQDQADCLLLACLDVELDAQGNLVFVLDAEGALLPGDVQVDDCDRPVLAPNRLKQEFFNLLQLVEPSLSPLELSPPLAGLEMPVEPEMSAAADDNEFVTAPAGAYENAAAGTFDANGNPVGIPYNGLTANFIAGDRQYLLSFPDYKEPSDEVNYMIKATLFGDPSAATTFHVLGFETGGINVCVTRPGDGPDPFERVRHGFMIEISRYRPEERLFRRRVNINTATVGELRSLPRIGPELANRIVANRETEGLFDSANDLTRVSGIGPSLLADVRPFIFVRS
jgi:competence ComEA-like helix-hairpin-helix protein